MSDIDEMKKTRIMLASNQQRKAANPQKSVWVEASAGTGKTKVLSDRVLRLLLKGVMPAKILCLTYTKAAAVEMNTRIAGRLSRWAVIKDAELVLELEALLGKSLREIEKAEELKAMARKLFAILLDTPGGMKIQTIHSFCQEVLKRFPIEAKISPYFEVMDDRLAREALEEVKQKLLQKIELEPQSDAAKALGYITKNVSEYTFPKIMNSIAGQRSKISRLFAQYQNLEELVLATANRLEVGINDTKESVFEGFLQSLDEVLLKKIMEALFHGSESDKKRAEDLASFLSGDRQGVFEKFRAVFLTKDGEIRKTLATKSALAFWAEVAEAGFEVGQSLQELENKLASVGLFESTKAVLLLARDLISGYNFYKKIHSKMDYEDLIVLTRNLLENRQVSNWVLFKLDGGIDNILIDEAQDTSPDQWAIVKALSADFFSGADERLRTVFAVGDRKQSIYSFQGADPQEFENMRRYFADSIKEQGNFEEVKLEVSFRSTAAILDVVNNVFASTSASKGVVLEGEDITHTPSRIGEGGKVELWPLVEAEESENEDVYLPPVERKSAPTTSSRLAKQIAEQIKKMVLGKEILVSKNRPIAYRDFLILVQRRNSFVEELVRECKNADVNIAGVDKIRLLEQIAVQDLVALGRFLLLPSDDLTLATVLKSPIFGLNDDDLFLLCYERFGKTLWNRLSENPKYLKIYQVLQDLLNKTDFIRPFELFAYVLNKLEGHKKFVARLGVEAEDGLDEFVNLTLNFEQEHIPTLQNFIDWIAKDEVEIKRELEQSDIDAVRIMTVHGSKGLQAPIVILPDTVRVKNIRNEAGLLLDDLMYYPLSSADYERNCKSLKTKEKEMSLEEYRRLLYVALTRAEERLCVCGYKKKNKVAEESWYEICKKAFGEIGQSFDDGRICYEVSQQIEVKENIEAKAELPKTPDFEWLHKDAPLEEALAKPLSPSKMEEDEEIFCSPIGEEEQNSYARGRIIHKLLQILPDVKNRDKAVVIEEFLCKNAAEMKQAQRQRIQKEVLYLLDEESFGAIFGENSKAEVPIMGMIEGKIISGQIDRLVVEKDRVLIVDFKTNRPAAQSLAEVPVAYIKQMNVYKKLVEKIYVGKKVEAFILWTDVAQFMKI